ncbi:MAG: hypothetical protein M0D57_09990 [Sphingobacteriales bacterium JAD_PAG50586_3]|nr:MAG: hypothetical protein M0D57_09990 [Sphingobacteriales bacterium JAD_PAG50586_3]
MRFLNPGSFGIVILCFLLPFINIKCNGVKLITLSGVQMATGANINAGDQGMFGKRMMDETSTADKTKMMSIPLLVTLIVLVAALATVLTMTLKNKDQRKIRRTAIVFHGVVIFGLIAEMGRMEYSIIHANNYRHRLGP